MIVRASDWASRLTVVILSIVLVGAVFAVPASADPRCQNNNPFYGYCVGGKILEEFNQAGGLNFFGNATNAESNTQNGGKFQRFVKNSSIYWHSAVANGHANQIGGLIRDAWGRTNWETGYLGYPITREFAVSGGRANHMMAGSIYWSQSTGAQNIWLGIRDQWAADGYETGKWGFPLQDTRTTTCDVWAQSFQGGVVLYKSTGISNYFLGHDDVDTGPRMSYEVASDFNYVSALESALSSWNQLGAVAIEPDSGALDRTDVRFSVVDRDDVDWSGRHTYYGGALVNTIQINTYFVSNMPNAQRAGVIAHEIGHALGLDHTCANDLMAPNDSARGTNYTPTGLSWDLYRNKWGF